MKKNKIILISVLVFLILTLDFVYWLNYIKPTKSGTPEAEKIDLCAKFFRIQDAVRCETARAAVLEKYPGEIKYIRRTKADLPEGVLPNVTMVRQEVWLIGVNLKPPMELDERELKGMEIFVTRNEGKLEINKLVSGEL